MTLSSTIIKINDIKLYGFHGVTLKEQKLGNNFIINLAMTIKARPDDFEEDSLDNTINYAEAYEILKCEFQITSATLENLAIRIIKQLFSHFPILEECRIDIQKLNPPFPADCRSASVDITMKR